MASELPVWDGIRELMKEGFDQQQIRRMVFVKRERWHQMYTEWSTNPKVLIEASDG